MEFITFLALNLLFIVAVMTSLWLLSLLKRDASVVDPFWGLGFVLVSWFCFSRSSGSGFSGLVLCVLVTIWGLRLSGYLLWRNWGEEEDRRYAAMREKHGASFAWKSLITVFLLQGLVMWLVSFPIQAGVYFSEWAAPGIFALTAISLGACIWLVGLLFETIGDWQLAQFKAKPDNRGKVLESGLWRYTRHPNYFGDFCIWWGIYIVSLASGVVWTIFAPLLMSVLLLKVSGVSLLEKDISDRRPDYQQYILRTNAFFPGPPH
jgi:steroid 5-alpha reductase family enzyme